MDHTIFAATDCEIGATERDALAPVVKRSDAISLAIWRAKLVEEAILRKWLVYTADAYQAVGHLLCELFVRSKMAGLTNNGVAHLPLIQEELADALGLTSVHVNRILRRLKGERFVDFSHQRLAIFAGAKFARAVEFDPGYLTLWHHSKSGAEWTKVS